MIKKYKVRVNEEIKAREVRVVSKEGKQIGIMSVKEALEKAYEEDLDLVEVAPHENPPVCKIMDYDKYRYEQEKKERKESKRHKKDILKEIWLTPNINEHDYKIKLRHIEEFLKLNERVKIRVKFKGRQMEHMELGEKLIERVKEDTKEYSKVVTEKKEGSTGLTVTLTPKIKK